MSMRLPRFTPAGPGSTTRVVVSPTSQVIRFDNELGYGKSRTARLWNAGPGTVYFDFVGNPSAQVSTSTGVPLPAGSPIPEKFTAPSTQIAVICDGGSAILFVTPGEGL